MERLGQVLRTQCICPIYFISCKNILVIAEAAVQRYSKKNCSKKMQQIYKRTPMPKCDFNKVAKSLYWNRTSVWVSPVNLSPISRTPFPRNTSGWLLLCSTLWLYFAPGIYQRIALLLLCDRLWTVEYRMAFVKLWYSTHILNMSLVPHIKNTFWLKISLDIYVF